MLLAFRGLLLASHAIVLRFFLALDLGEEHVLERHVLVLQLALHFLVDLVHLVARQNIPATQVLWGLLHDII